MEIIKRAPIGELSEIIIKYVNYKRTLGYKYINEEGTLYRFSLFTQKYNIVDKTISSELLMDWMTLRKGEKAITQRQRISCILQMIKFATNYGYQVNIPDTPHIKTNRYEPYIFTGVEISNFFKACDSFGPYPGSWRHIVVPVLFRLIYSCGLRVSEALNLKCQDVNINKGIITIHEAKFDKDRLVPVSASMLDILRAFYFRYRNETDIDMYFFPAKYNEGLERHIVYTWFRQILEKAGIHHLGKGKGPREHDLRHSFCVHALKSMQDSGMDLYASLPVLSTYVGHASIYATQHYLRLTAEFYPEIINQINRKCGNIIPRLESVDDENN